MQTSRTFSIHFWINSAKQKNNLSPVYARITVNGNRAEISLKRSISVTSWDPKCKRAKARTEEGRALNQYLDRVYANLLECHKQLLEESKYICAHAIKARFLGEDDKDRTLMDLISYHNQNMKSILKPGTLKNYYTTERYVQSYLNSTSNSGDIYLKQLSYKFIIDFEQYLRSGKYYNGSKALENNGVMKHLERLKKMSKLAMRLEWIEKDPFIKFSLKFKKYERCFLNLAELQAMENVELKHQKHRIARDTFIFACYTGLSYIDVKQLTGQNLVKGIDGNYWIHSKREKTNEPLKIPLLEKALDILKTYNCFLKSSEKLLPIYSNQKTNYSLKDIAAMLKINKRISFHVARHTFATTVTLSNGVPIETVSRLLGHTKLATTQVYAKVLEQKVSDDMSNLRRKLNLKRSDGPAMNI